MQAHTAYAAQAASAVLAPRPAENTAMPALYRAALGSQQTERYLAFFQRQDDTGRTLPGWNAAAAFFTLGWMVFRQLWAPALVYLAAVEGVALLIFVLGHQWLAAPLPVLAGVALAFWCAACVVPGFYGDAAMHAEVRKKITKSLSASANLPQAVQMLARQAPTRRRLAWVIAAHAALAAVALLVWLAVPGGFRAADGSGPIEKVAQAQDAPAAAGALTTGAASSAAGRPGPTASSDAAGSAGTATAPAPAASAAASVPKPTLGPMASAPVPASADAPQGTVPPPAAAPLSAATERTAPSSAAASATPASTERAARTARPTMPASVATGAAKASAPRSRASAAAAPAEPTRRQLYINAGLFGDPDNARRAHARLREAGLPASTAQVRSSSGRMLTRVRAGPFTSAAQANAAMAQVQLLGLEAAPAQR